MENEKPIDESIVSLDSVLTDTIKTYWSETRKWSLFFAIMAMIFTGIMLLASVAMIAASSQLERAANMPFSGGTLSAAYFLFTLLYVLPIYYLFKFNSHSKRAIETDSIEAFEQSLNYIKLLFRYSGVMSLVVIALYIIVILLFVVGAGNGLF